MNASKQILQTHAGTRMVRLVRFQNAPHDTERIRVRPVQMCKPR